MKIRKQNHKKNVKNIRLNMKFQINSDPEKFIKDSLEDGSDVDINELEENMANLENIIAAGASASNKRNSSKK